MVKSLLKIIEWAVSYLCLTTWERINTRLLFKQEPKNLRRIYVLEYPASMARAYNEIPLFFSILLQAAAFTFLILGMIAESNPHLIWISFGAGISASVTINSLLLIVQRLTKT